MKAAFLHWFRTLTRVALGLFILWQLLFLVGANSLHLLDATDWVEGEGTLHETLKEATKVSSRWSELTQQPQDWSLFAPGVTDHIPFLELEFRWDDRAPIHWLSPNEPEDIQRFLRCGRFRLRRYEGTLDVTMSIDTDKTEAGMADAWRSIIENRLKGSSGEVAARLAAYVQWRYRAFQRVHPELLAPKQVIVNVRLYAIAAPGSGSPIWSKPDTRPMCRFRSELSWPPDSRDVEMFNPVTEQFEKSW
jgi:hypothetical protein